jgi:hypothetical protein
MHVGIHETRHQGRTVDVEHFVGVTITPSHHGTIRDRETGLHPLAGGRGKNATSSYQEIDGLVSAGSGQSFQ